MQVDAVGAHMGGHWDGTGTQMVEAIARVAGGRVKQAAFPWWVMKLASPFVTTLREMQEMRYLWRQPVQLDNAKLVATIGVEPHTPWDAAIRATLTGLGCMPALP